MMLLVPAPTEKTNAVSGASSVICLGCFAMIPAATVTIQSMPPAACISEAAVTTARMIEHRRDRRLTRRFLEDEDEDGTPRPPQSPTPTPPARVPITIAPRTTRASRTN